MSRACPGGVVHAGEEDEGELVGVVGDRGFEIVGPQRVLPGPRPDHDQVAARVEPARDEMRGQRVPVAREERAIGQDPAARPRRAEERREQQVEVDRQAVHQADLVRPGTDDPRHRRAERIVECEPWSAFGEPGTDPEARPGVELRLDGGPRGPWLQAERLARQVDGGRPVRVEREQEPIAHRGERIGRVARQRVGLGHRAGLRGW